MDPYRQNQPPYPQQPPYQPPNPPQGQHPQQGQYPQQPYYGPPQPQWQSSPPQKKSEKKFWWILGSIVMAVTLLSILGFAGCSALAQELNGGGGSQAEKAGKMVARVDNVPESDWTERFRHNPKVDPGCLSIDTSCLKLTAGWSVDHQVSLADVANRFGMEGYSDGSPSGNYTGCVEREDESVSKESLCIDESPDDPGTYLVTIRMERD